MSTHRKTHQTVIVWQGDKGLHLSLGAEFERLANLLKHEGASSGDTGKITVTAFDDGFCIVEDATGTRAAGKQRKAKSA